MSVLSAPFASPSTCVFRDLNISDSANVLKIPEHCVVNSRAHIRKYNSKINMEDYDASFFRSPPNQVR